MTLSPKDGARRYVAAVRTRILGLARSNPGEALALAAYYGAFLHHNYIGTYADPGLEYALTEALASRVLPSGSQSPNRGGVLHLATELYAWGGHTRVIERLVRSGMGDAVATVLPMPESVRAGLSSSCRTVDPLTGANGIDTVRHVVEAADVSEAVILHIHPFDIASAVAAAILARRGVRILLYNHADHGFGFGFQVAEKVLELSKYGWEKASRRRIEGKQAFVGIPADVPAISHAERRRSRHVLMSGWSEKFRPFGAINAGVFIDRLVERLDAEIRIDVVGPRGSEPAFKNLGPRARRCVSFRGLVPHERFGQLLAECGVYVDSFPQGNGTGFVEALLAGAPCFGLDLLAGASYADGLRSHTVEELVERVAAYLQGELRAESQFDEARRLVRIHQAPSACASRIEAVLKTGACQGLPREFSGARCMSDFYERYWEAAGRIALVARAAVRLSASTRFWLLAQAAKELARTGILEWGKLAWISLTGTAPTVRRNVD